MSTNILVRYEKALAIRSAGHSRAVLNDAVFAHWIGNTGCFWYKRASKSGDEYRLVDAKAASNMSAFDHEALARALATATGTEVSHHALPIRKVTISLSPLAVRFEALDGQWEFDGARCKSIEVDTPAASPAGNNDFYWQAILKPNHAKTSPDGNNAVFVRDDNLWIRDHASKEARPLTRDGTPDCSYGRDPFYPTYVQALWSPDSRRIFTVQVDTRQVAARPIIGYVTPDDVRPQLTHLTAAYPGDEHVERYRLLTIDVATGAVQRVDHEALPILRLGELPEYAFLGHKPSAWWSPDGGCVYFLDVVRGGNKVRVVRLDPDTGATQPVIEETSDTFVKLVHQYNDGQMLFVPLPETNELVWFSERTGWGHLYLYDMETGQLKHAVTKGEWLVRDVLHYDAKRRELLVQTAGRDPEISPYYRDVCKVNIDTGQLTTLASGPHEHIVYQPLSFPAVLRWSAFLPPALCESPEPADGVSPDGAFVVVTRSRVDTPAATVLIDRAGNELLELETADVSGLPTGWQWPEPVKLKGADGTTDIHGVVFRPPDFSPDECYPVVNFSNSMPFLSTLPQGSFTNSTMGGAWYLMAASIAALGFIVVVLEGRGLPLRSKAFQDHRYGDLSYSNDFEDRISAIRQLALRYSYMDLNRVGITGDENISNNVYSLLRHSDFFKVCVVNCVADPRFSFAAFSEIYGGLRDQQAIAKGRFPEDEVSSFGGKLLLIQGMLADPTPAGTFRLVEALQKANKDFDMLCLPNLRTAMSGYTQRREWDFLVRHLQGVEPPEGFLLP